jgi:hypothetical protein
VSHRLTVTYRTVREQSRGGHSTVVTAHPGRSVDLDVTLHYVRDGGLFYRQVGEAEGTEHMVPLDLIYHYATGAESPPP